MAIRSTWRTASSRTPGWPRPAPRIARSWRCATPRAGPLAPTTRSWPAWLRATTSIVRARWWVAAVRTTPGS
jgi:hypothetical protein